MGDYGEKVGRLLQQENFEAMYKGAGIAIAVSLAELLVVLFLALIYRAGEMRKNGRQEGYGTESGFVATISSSVISVSSGRVLY